MTVLSKIGQVLLLFVFIYLWNRFIVKMIYRKVVGFHERKNLDKHPIKYLAQNELKMIKVFSGFYWICGIMISK